MMCLLSPGQMTIAARIVLVTLFYGALLTQFWTTVATRTLGHCRNDIYGSDGGRCFMLNNRRMAISFTPASRSHDRTHFATTVPRTSPSDNRTRQSPAKSRDSQQQESRDSSEDEYVRNSSADYNIISETCAGAHGLEVQQDNTGGVYLRGLPVFHVTVINTCLECSLTNIHIACGDWASATEVNPKIFRRIAHNDCVVNDGKAVTSQEVLYFEYSNSFAYPMNVRSATPSCS